MNIRLSFFYPPLPNWNLTQPYGRAQEMFITGKAATYYQGTWEGVLLSSKIRQSRKINLEDVGAFALPAYVSKLDIDMAETLKDAREFRDDVQTYDSVSSLLETVRSAIQGLFIDKSPEQCGAAIVKEIKAKE